MPNKLLDRTGWSSAMGEGIDGAMFIPVVLAQVSLVDLTGLPS